MIVLLPGMDGTGELFGDLTNSLLGDLETRVVRYPRDAPWTYSHLESHVREQLPTGKSYVIVAESFSGPIAIRLAADPPEGLAGLVLVATFLTSPRAAWAVRVAATVLRRLPQPPRWVVRSLLVGRSAPAALVDKFRATVAGVPRHVLASRLLLIARVGVTKEAREVDLPVLVIRPTRDRLVPRRAAKALIAGFRAAEVVDVPGPHLLLQREPEACARAIVAFWRSVDRSLG